MIYFFSLALVGFANARVAEDPKQVLSSFMYVISHVLSIFPMVITFDLFRLSISAVVVTYMQNPAPMTIPFMQ